MDTSLFRTRTLVALGAAFVLPLAACGSDDSDTTDTSSSSTTTSSSAAESPSEASSEEAPAEGQATSAKAGISFETPEGWTSMDPSELVTNPDEAPEAVKKAAEAQGTTVEALVQQFASQTDLLLLGETTDGFASNINVVAAPAMPTDADLKSQLEGIGGTVEGTEETETAIGTGSLTTYTLTNGGTTIQGRMLAIPTDSGAALVTVSTADAGEADEVASLVADTVATA